MPPPEASTTPLISKGLEILFPDQLDLFKYSKSTSSKHLVFNALHPRMFHTLSILGCVSLRTLYVFSGWNAMESESAIAGEQLSKWIAQSGQAARKSLFHAVTLFDILRNSKDATFLDPLYMAIATIYMWTYVKLVKWQNPLPDRPRQIRLDQEDRDVLRSWLIGDQFYKIYINDAGILTDNQNPDRILREAMRKLLRERSLGWSTLHHGVARALGQVLEGKIPTLETIACSN